MRSKSRDAAFYSGTNQGGRRLNRGCDIKSFDYHKKGTISPTAGGKGEAKKGQWLSSKDEKGKGAREAVANRLM